MTFISKILPKKSRPSKPVILKRPHPLTDKEEFKGRGKVLGISDIELEEVFEYLLKDDQYLESLKDVIVQMKLAEDFPKFNQRMKEYRRAQELTKQTYLEKLELFKKGSKTKEQMEEDYSTFESALELAKTFTEKQKFRTIDFYFLYHISDKSKCGYIWGPSSWTWKDMVRNIKSDPNRLLPSYWNSLARDCIQSNMQSSLNERGMNPLETH